MPFPGFLHKEDAILLLVLGLAGGWVLYKTNETLHKFRDATRITKQEKTPDIIGQHTEDAISVDTLGELHNSTNWSIRQASVKILVERAIRHPNVDLLLHNAASKKPQMREEAMTVLAFLIVNERGEIHNPKIYKVIVDALVAYLPATRKREHEPHTDWKLRSPTERHALVILRYLMITRSNDDIQKWLDAGLITRWLGRYPMGGSEMDELVAHPRYMIRCQIVDTIKNGFTDDRALEYILNELVGNAAARIQLRKYKLIGYYADNGEDLGWDLSARHDSAISHTDTAPARRNNDRNVEGEGSSSETARRRRRREAVVIGDAGQPLSQDNIFNVDSELLEHGEEE